MGYAHGSAYCYQIRSNDGTVGYVGQYENKYVFTPLTYEEFPAAMLMAKALNKRTMNEHEVVTVKKRLRVNGRYGPMRRSAITPVRGDEFERPSPRNEVPPEISKEAYEARDAVDPDYDANAPVGGEDADYAEEYMRRLSGSCPRNRPQRRVGEVDVELCY